MGFYERTNRKLSLLCNVTAQYLDMITVVNSICAIALLLIACQKNLLERNIIFLLYNMDTN